MTEWQPIETAPKDGTLVLILERHGRRQVAKWCAPGYEDYGWFVQLTSSGPNDAYPTTDVTHWAPLPDPPQVAIA